MVFEIKEITQKNIWEDFLLQCQEKTFLQSFNWGQFQELQGNKIFRFGVFEGTDLISVCMVVLVKAKRGKFLLVQHGPVTKTLNLKFEILNELLNELKKLAKKEKVYFIRISPLFLDNEENRKIFKNLGFRLASMHASAYEATWKLDITLPEEKLLANMRKTTRYLIKKAEANKDIGIEVSTNLKDIEIYQKLNKEVAKRQKFVGFSDKYIKNEFEIFDKDSLPSSGQAIFLFGKYKGEVVAGAMIVLWQGVAYYHQAASLGKFAKFSIPYLLQWTAIKEAKNRGCVIYDFWGFTDPGKFPKHPWAGPTLFKMGFGGGKTEYIKTQDFVIAKKYWLNYIIEKFRKFKRGL